MRLASDLCVLVWFVWRVCFALVPSLCSCGACFCVFLRLVVRCRCLVLLFWCRVFWVVFWWLSCASLAVLPVVSFFVLPVLLVLPRLAASFMLPLLRLCFFLSRPVWLPPLSPAAVCWLPAARPFAYVPLLGFKRKFISDPWARWWEERPRVLAALFRGKLV